MQSSPNELSTLLSNSVKYKQTKVDKKCVKLPKWPQVAEMGERYVIGLAYS